MAQFEDTKVRGKLNVKEEITQGDLKYNISSLKENNGNKYINTGDQRLPLKVSSDEISLDSNKLIIKVDNKLIGTGDPIADRTLNGTLTNIKQGQIYFRIVD